MWLIALKVLAGTSKLGERQKIGRKRATVAPYFEKIRCKCATVAPYFSDLRDTLPVSPSPQPRAPRPAGTLPYAYSSPAHQSSHAPPGTRGS